MISRSLKAAGLKLYGSFVLLLYLCVFPSAACRSVSRDSQVETRPEIQKLRRELVALKRREKSLEHEIALARSFDPYLVIDLDGRKIELKAKGRTLRTFSLKDLKQDRAKIPEGPQALKEIKPYEKSERPRMSPGKGESATIEAVQQGLWGLQRMPADYNLVCRNDLTLEFRALPSAQTGSPPARFLKTAYRKILDRFRHKSASGGTAPTIKIWLEENDSRLLFWSLPPRMNILILGI